jgi:hypothetical protein
MAKQPSVVVAGDVMIDWNLSVDRDKIVTTRSWADAGEVRRERQFGGAWLLEDLIRSLGENTGYAIRGIPRPDDNAGVHQTYTVVTPASDGVLRVDEFLGVEKARNMTPLRVDPDDADAAVVALLDSDLDFDRYKKSWPAALTAKARAPWVVLKTAVPDFEQELWRHLVGNHADRLAVVVTIDDLRRKGMQLIRRLSWERTAEDLVVGLRKSPALQALQKCGYLIVSFGAVGSMLFPRDADPLLVFDPATMETEWPNDKKSSGKMIGYTSILAATLVHEVMIHPEWPQFADALPRGIAGMRALFDNGFGTHNERPQVDRVAIAKAILQPGNNVVPSVTVHEPSRKWTILHDRLSRAKHNFPSKDINDALYELAARVTVYGPEEALSDVPQLSIGNLFTVDREEIESYRSIKVLLTEYVERAPSEPISLAVFGSPGSGKSFGVKEIIKSIGGSRTITPLTFNLTQFGRAEELRAAFHQVRDVSLRGELPLVFWDEFDTTYGDRPLGWLRYFISPMQDGTFQEEQITHPIGTSIFVFAGGTATSKDDFVNARETEERKALKVPDFISRLKGFLNVTGPNRRTPDGDPHYLIRRATVLRSMLQRHYPDLFRKEGKRTVLQIAPAVLHAFLNTKTYVHGARSLESVLTMSTLAGRKKFYSSSLPPEAQLALHVALPFESLCEYLFTHDVEKLEQQASLAHQAFLDIKKKQSWMPAEIRDDGKRRHNLLVEYEALPEHEKESNRSTVRMIPAKLASVGYAIAPAGTARSRQLTAEDIERLAKNEHEIWMKRKLERGYVLGSKATESPKQSPYLVPWTKLGKQWKDVDRAMVQKIPEILEVVDYIIVDANDVP